MRSVDRRAVAAFGLADLVLMENGGLGKTGGRWGGDPGPGGLWAVVPGLRRRRVLVLCGRGNNGGDGFVVARHLAGRGVSVEALLLARPGTVAGSAAINLAAARRRGIPLTVAAGPDAWRRFRRRLDRFDLAIDAILGTGLSRPVSGFLARVFDALLAARIEMAAVDVPSGLAG